MATENTTNHIVNVTDEGSTDKVIKKIGTLLSRVEAVQVAAAKINIGASGQTAAAPQSTAAKPAMSAGTAGSRAAAQAAKPSSMQIQEYTNLRGSAGGTGSSARDFAKQSEGLGGLVRLYATYAANLYAATAAFNALKAAQDTTNMVRGLEQLGAASGVALGALSQRLTEVTQGALSFRESMKVTAQVTSAGFGSMDVEAIGKAGTKIAQALGLDAADAVTRLTRAVTKLEPELLDELGIFLKIDDVVQKYALSVGKTVGQVTEFERRQAFLNAAVGQANTKFGEIAIDVNPYNQLAASLANVGQKIAEVANTIIGPFVALLSSSPTALYTTVAALAALLIKQAVPAITDFRESLRKSTEEAAYWSNKRKDDAIAAEKARTDFIEKEVTKRADKEVNIAADAEERLKALKEGKFRKGSLLDKVSQASAQEIEQEGYVQKLKDKAQQEQDKGRTASAQYHREYATALEGHIKAEKELMATQAKARAELEKDPSLATTRGQTAKAALDSERAVTKANIIANAGYAGSVDTLRSSFSSLNEEIKKSNLTGLGKASTYVQGSFAILTGKISTAVSAFGAWGAAVGIGIQVAGLLNDWLSKNSEETNKFNQALDQLKSTTKNTTAVLNRFSELDPLGKLTVQSTIARATAVNELTQGLTKTVEALLAVDKAAGAWDKFWDGAFSVVGKDLKSTSGREISVAIADIIASSDEGPAKTAYLEKINKIFGATSAAGINKSVNNMTIESYKSAIKEVDKANKDFNKTQQEGASRLKEVEDAFKATDKAYNELAQSFSKSTPLTKFAEQLQASAGKLLQELKTPEMAIKSIMGLLENPSKGGFLEPETFKMLMASSDKIKEVYAEIDKQEANIREKQAKLADTNLSRDERSSLQASIKYSQEELAKAKERGVVLAAPLVQAMALERFRAAGKALAAETEASLVRQEQTIRKSYSSLFTGPRAVEQETDLAKQDLQVKIKNVEATLDLVQTNKLLKLSIEKETAQRILDSDKSTAEQKDAAKNSLLITGIKEAILTSKNPAILQKALTSAGSTPEAKQAVIDTQADVSRVTDLINQLNELQASAKAITIQGAINVARARGVEAAEALKRTADKERAELSALTNQKGLNAQLTVEERLRRDNLQKSINQNEQAAERKGLEVEIETLAGLQVRKQDEQIKKQELAQKTSILNGIKDKQLANDTVQIGQTKLTNLQDEIDIIELKYKIESADRAEAQKALEFRIQITNRALALEQEILTARENLGLIVQQEFIAEKSILELQKLDRQLVDDLTTSTAKNTEELAAQQKIIDENTQKWIASKGANQETLANINRAVSAQERLGNELAETNKQLNQETKVRKNIVTQAADLAKFEADTARNARISILELEMEYNLRNLQNELVQSTLDIETSSLERRKAGLLVTEKEYILEKNRQDINKIEQDRQVKIDAATQAASKQRIDTEKKLLDAKNKVKLLEQDQKRKQAEAQIQDISSTTEATDLSTVIIVPNKALEEAKLLVESLVQDYEQIGIKLNNTVNTTEQLAQLDKLRVGYAAELQAFIEEQNKLYKRQQDIRDLEFTKLELITAKEQDRVNRQSMLLESRKTLGLITDKEYQTLKSIVDLEKGRADAEDQKNKLRKESADRSANIRKEIEEAQKRVDIANKAAEDEQNLRYGKGGSLMLPPPVQTTAQIQAQSEVDLLKEKLAKEQELADFKFVALSREADLRLYLLKLQGEQNVLQAQQTEQMTKLNSATETLNSLFVNMGGSTPQLAKSIGEIGTAILTNSQQQETLNKKREDEIRIVEMSANDEEDFKNKSAQINKKFAREQQKLDLDTAIKGASAAKMMFKEKTAAHKVFAAFEKAMMVVKLATLAAEIAGELGLTAISVSASATRASAKGTESIVNAMKDLPTPFNFVAGAAMTAIVASLLGSAFSKKPTGFGGVTAAQRQETQGTAMGYNAQTGEKIQVRRGVFGDENAKSESIAKSIDLIAKNSVDGLDYDNKMLRALQGLRDALTKSAQSLFGVKGLRSGSMFETPEGTNTSGGFLGIGGLFSKSTTQSIIDSGLQLKGTFLELARTGGGLINSFEVVSTTTKKSGFFGLGASTKTTTDTKFQDLGITDPKAATALRAAFGYAGDLLYSIGEQAGKLPEEINRAMGGVNVDELVSLRGLTGEDFTKQLESVIGAVLDDASLVLFSEFEKFAKFGEGMLETVVRVVDTNTKINQAVKNIGTSISKQVESFYTSVIINGVNTPVGKYTAVIASKLSDAITEALANVSGGLDKFLDKVENFRTNFLTEQERLAPITAAYKKGLTDLGYSANISREELKGLIQNFDLFDPAAGRAGKSTEETYVALLDIADGFNKVATAAEAAANKISDEREGLQRKLDELTMSTEAFAKKWREVDITKIDTTNRALQRQIWAQENLNTVAKIYASRLEDTAKTLKSQISSLTEYKSALMSGDKSTLTATEQYARAKGEVESLLTTINKTVTTPEEVEARNTAIGKLTGATDKFLGLSRQLYASGAQYNVDFSSVLDIISSVGTGLDTQLTDAQLQLEEVKTSNTFLQSIDASSKSTVTLLNEYLTAQSNLVIANAAATSAAVTAATTAATTAVTTATNTGTTAATNNAAASAAAGTAIPGTTTSAYFGSGSGTTAPDNFVAPGTTSQVAIATTIADLRTEIQSLNENIAELQQVVADGAALGAAATDRNTEAIVSAIDDGNTFNKFNVRAMVK